MRYLFLNTVEPQNNQDFFLYKIADSLYQCDTKIDELDFLFHSKKSKTDRFIPCSNFIKPQQIYQDNTLIGEKEYLLKVNVSQDLDYQLEVDSNQYVINSEGIHGQIKNIDLTILTGPVVILNLAINRVFCLHASAFIMNNKTFILMANSGTGKSTIARYINQKDQCQRIADDIVPVKFIDNNAVVLANFPQLKLPQKQQYSGSEVVNETVLLFVEKSKSQTVLSKVDRFNSLKKIIKHSVATRLFAKRELQSHLQFCHQIASHTDCYQVKYQHSSNGLQDLYGLLDEI